jgi:ankyrin repeat protein/GNAT superfamily N-acetyltransferase
MCLARVAVGEAFAQPEPDWFCYVIVTEDGSLVGFAKGVPHDGAIEGFGGELNKIYLLRKFHRQGLGRRLLGHLSRRFLAQGITSTLLFGDAHNPSNGFYEALGAARLLSPEGEFHGGYGWRDLHPLAKECPTDSAVWAAGGFFMIKPKDLQDEDIWSMLQASRDGDLNRVQELVARRPELVRCEYNYTPPIHFAVREGHTEVVRFLLAQGADASSYRTYPFQDSLLTMAEDREYREVVDLLLEMASRRFPAVEGLAEFLDAVQNANLSRVRQMLAENPMLARSSDDTGDTGLHRAATIGHFELMNLLLDSGAEIDAVRGDGYRPMHCALKRGRKPALNAGAAAGILLGRGAAYNIYLAAVFGDDTYVQDALTRDPSLANFEDTAHWRPISAAAARNDLNMVKLLLEHGADPSLPEEGAPLGQALWLAVYQAQFEMARILLEHGANPDTAPESSGSAISHTRKNPELRKLLLDYGAKEQARPMDDLARLFDDNNMEELEKRLKEKGALDGQNAAFWGEGILAGPANRGNRPMIELLMRYGARVPDLSKWGRYYYFKHTEIAKLLLDNGMNPNHMNWHHVTLLHDMAQDGDLEKARLLLDHGADINAVDEEYCSTPLGLAARWGHRGMVALLLERGADPIKSGASWSTPLAWARKKGHAEIEAMLAAAVG